jgi:hypothetical protein
MATKRIRLTRLWDGHPAGEIVTEQDFTVDSMVRKGYGMELPTEADRADVPVIETAMATVPVIETAMATPQAETAVAVPQRSKRKTKNGVLSEQSAAVTPQNKEA